MNLRSAMFAGEAVWVRYFEPRLGFFHYISTQLRGQIGLFQGMPCDGSTARVFSHSSPPKDDFFRRLLRASLQFVTVEGAVGPIVEVTATRTHPLRRHLYHKYV